VAPVCGDIESLLEWGQRHVVADTVSILPEGDRKEGIPRVEPL
jgi:hypothetical protein